MDGQDTNKPRSMRVWYEGQGMDVFPDVMEELKLKNNQMVNHEQLFQVGKLNAERGIAECDAAEER